MNKGLSIFLSFTLGAAAGSLVSWRILKNIYKQLADEEVEEVRQAYAEKYGEIESQNDIPEQETEEVSGQQKAADMKAYAEVLQKQAYHNYSDVEELTVEKDRPVTYVVDPTDFNEDYEVVTLTYYSDGVLVDEHDEKVEDPESLVGEDFEKNFEDGFGDSVVYIRNEDTKIEYEILYDPRKYSA